MDWGKIRLALHDFKIATDIIVTPEEFSWREEIPGTIERPVARGGRVPHAGS
ncbi:MAG: hypothetical protein QN168_15180 [Armatimonadota bacterium]|nr:hypothetical protein [Armatimonadota bacterium]